MFRNRFSPDVKDSLQHVHATGYLLKCWHSKSSWFLDFVCPIGFSSRFLIEISQRSIQIFIIFVIFLQFFCVTCLCIQIVIDKNVTEIQLQSNRTDFKTSFVIQSSYNTIFGARMKRKSVQPNVTIFGVILFRPCDFDLSRKCLTPIFVISWSMALYTQLVKSISCKNYKNQNFHYIFYFLL